MEFRGGMDGAVPGRRQRGVSGLFSHRIKPLSRHGAHARVVVHGVACGRALSPLRSLDPAGWM